MSNSTTNNGPSRRGFLAGMSLSAGSLALMGKVSEAKDVVVADAAKIDANSFNPDLFLSIATDGTVSVIAHRSEMGTGIRTSLPRVVADELEADWQRVDIVQGRGDTRYGSQNTDGSNSIRSFFDKMRTVGATARLMLEQAAAKQWKTDASQCTADNHVVKHKDGRSIGFGDLVKTAKSLEVPKATDVKLKKPSEWRYIGKPTPITDLDKILTGTAIYGIDAQMENQVHAVIARPPVFGGKVKSFDATAAKKVPGVVGIVEIPMFKGTPLFQPPGGIAVCATSTMAAIEGRDALKIKWDDGPNADHNTEEFARSLSETVNKPCKLVHKEGDALGTLSKAKADDVFKADYALPHLVHAPMEPPCSVADVKKDASGKVVSCHILCPTQHPQAAQKAVATALGLAPDDIVVDVTLIGSAFGRKSKADYNVEAAMISRSVGQPVKLTWTREDDVQNGYFHTMSAVHVEATIGAKGKPTAWLERVGYPTIASTFKEGATFPAPFELDMGLRDLPYDVPNIRLEAADVKSHMRIGWLRSVIYIPQIFAASSFVDELAHRAGRDPLEFLMDCLGDDRNLDLRARGHANRGLSLKDYGFEIGRLKHVAKRAAKMAGWGKELPKGRGLGIACARSFEGYLAYVVEVDVTKKGRVNIPNVWAALDTGVVISPDRVLNQVEGGAVMACGQAMYGKITFSDGRVDQSNFDEYSVPTMDVSPRNINVEIVKSEAKPAGVGEVSVPPFAPALCNAIFAATGKRIRSLPVADHDLKWS